MEAGAASRSRLADRARPFARAEIGYAIVLLSAFALPAGIGYRAWIPALAIGVVLAAAHGAVAGHKPLFPALMLGYLGAYLITGVASDPDTFSLIEAGKYFGPPVFALAIAWAAQVGPVRRAIVLMIFAALAIQLPVVIGQVVDVLLQFGSDAAAQADEVSGLLDSYQGGTLTQVAILAAVVLLAATCTGTLGRRAGLVAALLALSFIVLTSTRAGYVFAPAAILALAATVALSLPSGGSSQIRPWVLGAFSIAIVPALIAGTGLVYPGANTGIDTVDGLLSTLSEGDQQLNAPPPAAQPASPSDGGPAVAEEPPPPPEQTGPEPTRLPGRGEQFTLALDLSDDDGIGVALLGRGMGSTRFKDQALLSDTGGATTDPITRPEQNTNGTWLARTITETGYLGLLAFLGLLGYLVALWWRNRRLFGERTWDAAVMVALPAIAALTLAGAAYNTILAIQPYATVFWALLGIAIAIDSARRRPA